MKPLVIYHANCADGFGAAFAAWLALGDDAEYLPMQYGDDLSTSIPPFIGRDVYILDFSFENIVTRRVIHNSKHTTWLDHHKTSRETVLDICGAIGDEPVEWKTHKFTIIHDNNRSGALLAWEHFHPGKDIPLFIRHIDDYDRWQFKMTGTKAINKALWSYAPWSFPQWEEFIGDPGFYGACFTEGTAILRAHYQNVQSVVRGSAMECEITTNMAYDVVRFAGISANCPPHLTSDVGTELAKQSSTFGLCWHINKDGKCICSLRSNGDYDVSAIAKAFGGGGHKNAAGFEVSIGTLLGWLK